jgi:hypothetical protein
MDSKKLNKLLDQFENAEYRFLTDVSFNRTLMLLADGNDPILVIDKLLKVVDMFRRKLMTIAMHGIENGVDHDTMLKLLSDIENGT